MLQVVLQKTILHSPEYHYQDGEVLASDLVRELLPDYYDHSNMVVNGEYVPVEHYENTVLEDGDLVHLSVVPREGISAGMWVYYAFLAATVYVGYVNAKNMIPSGEEKNEQLDRIQGMRNGPRKYEPVSTVLGRYRVTPEWLAEPYVETIGDTQYYNLLLSGGYGPQQLSDFRIGDTPLEQYEDWTLHYSGASGESGKTGNIQQYAHWTDARFRRHWSSDVSQESVGVDIEHGNIATRTTANETDKIKIDLRFPMGLIVRDNNKDEYTYKSLYITVSEQDSGQTFRIAKANGLNPNSTALSGASTGDVYRDTSGNFYAVDYGSRSDGKIANFQNKTNLDFNSGFRAVRANQVLNQPSSEIIPISSAHIHYYDPVNGIVAISNSSPHFDKIRYTITNKTRKEFFEGIVTQPPARSDGTPVSNYNISITDAVGVDEDHRDDYAGICTWDYLTSYRNIAPGTGMQLLGSNRAPKRIGDNFYQTFEPVALVLRIKASNQLSGMLDKFNYEAISMVPSNWDSDWRAWNAPNMLLKPSENPAELYRWTMQGPFNANPLPNERIDLDGLAEWRDYCDEYGWGGKNIPLRVSALIRDASTLLPELNKIAFTGMAKFSFVDGKYGVSIDKRKTTPVQLITNKNSFNFSTSREYPEVTDGIKYQFYNKDEGYERDEGIYYDPYIAPEDRKGIYEGQEIPYVSDPELAQHHARFLFFKKVLRREAYSLEMDVENLKCTTGDLVLVQNDVIDVGRGAGRVLEYDEGNNRFKLDETIDIVAGVQYVATVRTLDGQSIRSGEVRYQGDQWWEIINPQSTSLIVERGALVSYGDAGVETLRCIVEEIDHGSDLSAKLTLVNYTDQLYDINEDDLPEYSSNLTRRPSYRRPYPPRITANHNPADLANGTAIIRFSASNGSDADISFFSLEGRSAIKAYDEDGNPVDEEYESVFEWKNVGTCTAAEALIEVDLGLDNRWEFRGRAIGENGLISDHSPVLVVDVPTGASEDVVELILQENRNSPKTPDANLSTITARITPPDDPNFSYAVIEYRRVGQFQWTNVGRVGSLYENSVNATVSSDGTEYEFRAVSVSRTGVRSESEVTAIIRVYDVVNDPIDAGIKVPNVKGLEIFEQGNDTEFVGRDVEFNWKETSLNEWTPLGNEGGNGIDYGGLDLYFRDYEIKIYDSADRLINTYYSEVTTFNYNYEMNRQDYFKVHGEEGANRTLRVEVRIRGRNNQFSEKPARLVVTNPPPLLPVLIPTLGYTHISFNYNSPSDRDFVGIKVWMGDIQGFTPNEDNLVHDIGPDTSITVDGLEPGTAYYVVYQTFDAFGPGITSDEFEITTRKIVNSDLDDTPPTVPDNLVITSGVEESSLSTRSWVKLEWDESEDDGHVTGYFVSYRTDENDDPVEIFTSSLEYRITDAIPGREYFFKVKAQDWASNVSDYSDEVSIIAEGDTDAPAAPAGVTAAGGLDKVIVKWTNPDDDDFLAVRIHRGEDSSFEIDDGNLISTFPGRRGEKVEFVDAEVENGTTYYYRLVAVDVTGNMSGATSPVDATPNKLTELNISDYFAKLAIGNAYIANLDGNKITANSITTAQLAAGSVTADEIDVNQLSAISSNFGEMTSGTVTGALIRTSGSGARVELSSSEGITGRNSDGDITFHLDTVGSGFLGNAGGIQWDTEGNITVPSSLIVGDIVANSIVTTGDWFLRIEDGPIPLRYTDGTSTKFSLDENGNATYSGDITASTFVGEQATLGGINLSGSNAFVRAGKSGYLDNGQGVWIGRDGGVPKVNIGDGDNYVQYDGERVQIKTDKFSVDDEGNAVFSGDLQAAGGTFNGNLQAAGGTFSGELQAVGGTFSGNLQAVGGTIKGASFETSNFVNNVSGVRITSNGAVQINGVGSGSSRLSITNEKITVYDNNNRIRVELGLL